MYSTNVMPLALIPFLAWIGCQAPSSSGDRPRKISAAPPEHQWDLAPGVAIRDLSFHPSGQAILATSRSEAVFMISAIDNRPASRILAANPTSGRENEGVQCLGFNASGDTAFVVSKNRELIAKAAQGLPFVLSSCRGDANIMLRLPQGLFLVARGAELRVWSDRGLEWHRWSLGDATSEVGALATSRDGLYAAVGGADRGVWIYRVPHFDATVKVETVGPVRSLAFSPDGKYLAVAQPDHVRIHDVPSGALVRILRGAKVEHMVFATPEILIVSYPLGLSAWNLSAGKPLAHWEGSAITALAALGNWVAAGDARGAVSLWRVPLIEPEPSTSVSLRLPWTWDKEATYDFDGYTRWSSKSRVRETFLAGELRPQDMRYGIPEAFDFQLFEAAVKGDQREAAIEKPVPLRLERQGDQYVMPLQHGPTRPSIPIEILSELTAGGLMDWDRFSDDRDWPFHPAFDAARAEIETSIIGMPLDKLELKAQMTSPFVETTSKSIFAVRRYGAERQSAWGKVFLDMLLQANGSWTWDPLAARFQWTVDIKVNYFWNSDDKDRSEGAAGFSFREELTLQKHPKMPLAIPKETP